MAKSKEELISMIENDLVDPSTNKITGERVKNALTEMVDAMGTGSGNMEYWASGSEEISMLHAMVSSYVKYTQPDYPENGVKIYPAVFASYEDNVKYHAIAFDPNAILVEGDETMTLRELLALYDFDESRYTRITKEEFYTI